MSHMRDLQAVAQECIKELDSIGIKCGKIKEFKVNRRAQRWGLCRHYSNEGYCIIEISDTLLDERNDIKGLKNTIIHELLHSCTPGAGHKGEWKRLADLVRCKLGYNIKRVSNESEKGVLINHHSREKGYKYAVSCVDCGYTYRRKKLSKVITHPSVYHCGKCGGVLQRVL